MHIPRDTAYSVLLRAPQRFAVVPFEQAVSRSDNRDLLLLDNKALANASSQHLKYAMSIAEMEVCRISRLTADALVDDEREVPGVTWSRCKEMLLDFHFNVDRIFYWWVWQCMCHEGGKTNPVARARNSARRQMCNVYLRKGSPCNPFVWFSFRHSIPVTKEWQKCIVYY